LGRRAATVEGGKKFDILDNGQVVVR
jgi:hypothetical protein